MLLHPLRSTAPLVVATPTAASQLSPAPEDPSASNGHSTQEEPMNTRWQVRRAVVARGDGERRWDKAYPCLLHWAMTHEAGTDPAPSHREQAHSHARCPLGPGFDHPPPAVADD